MAAEILSGKEIASRIRNELKEDISQIKLKNPSLTLPGLAVIQVGENPASSIYVKRKIKACEEIGVVSIEHHLDDHVSQDVLLNLIDKLNADPCVNGILCQLPLPMHIDEFTVLCRIAPEKDVDGFHPMNKGFLSCGMPCLCACTPLGCLEILKRSNIPIAGKSAVVIGRSDIVGKPVAALLLAENATVTITHSKTKNLPEVCSRADILIAAIGKEGFVTDAYIKPGATVIDVGINRTVEGKVRGDVDFETASKVAGAITPVPGGVGPMTIAMLLKNTYTAYVRANSLEKDT